MLIALQGGEEGRADAVSILTTLREENLAFFS